MPRLVAGPHGEQPDHADARHDQKRMEPTSIPSHSATRTTLSRASRLNVLQGFFCPGVHIVEPLIFAEGFRLDLQNVSKNPVPWRVGSFASESLTTLEVLAFVTRLQECGARRAS